jgi:hypothetical protein
MHKATDSKLGNAQPASLIHPHKIDLDIGAAARHTRGHSLRPFIERPPKGTCFRQSKPPALKNMKRLLILVAAVFFFANASSAWADKPELQVKRDNTTVLTLRFGENALRLFSEVPSQLTAVLREHGIDCCTSQLRISETAWKCCHGKFSIVSSDARIQSALEAAFKGPKVVQR